MLGFLKSLLRKPQDTAVASEQVSAHESVPAAAPPAPMHHSHGGNSNPIRRNPVRQNGKGVDVPLQKILEGLPLELQPRVVQPEVGELTISVPLEKVLAQLSRGVVKVSFGELRQAAPDVFTLENDRDRVLVALPLSEILARLNPALITRRRVQRQVEVPEDISSPFDKSGQTLAIGGNGAQPEPQQAPQPVPVAPARQNGVVPPVAAPPSGTVSRTVAPPPAVPTHSAPPVRATVPPAPAAPPAPIAMPAAPTPRFTIAPTPPPAAPTHSPSTPPAPAPIAFTRTPPAATSAPAVPVAGATTHFTRDAAHKPSPAPAPAHAASPTAKSASGPDPLVISLTALAEAWPDSVRKEIIDANLVEAKVALPFNSVEQALKQGRIAFSWKSIRSWIKPAVLPSGSPHDSTVLELPLKLVAPLFLARQKQAGVQQKVSVDEDIPNLFFGFPQPEAAAPAAAATARPTDTNYYVWDENADTVKVHESELKRGPSPGTKFVAKYATPNEVVSRAAGLDGVVGALIALPDGLMVANRLPPEVNADTLAAFLPQIFGKMSQCTKELRMGELNNLNFTVGNVPWKIFRVNAIFFAAFGRAGEPLPTAQLAALAAELDHKPK